MLIRRVFLPCFSAWLSVFCSPAFAGDEQTQLRVSGEPTGTFETSFGTTELNSAKVEVRNIGSAPAEGVHVRVIVPDGRSGELHGPSTLSSNEKAVYSSDAVFLTVTKTGKLRAEATCSNCSSRSAAPRAETPGREQPATLRAKGPVGVFENIGGTTYIVDGSVEVRNASSVPATGVRVLVELPGGDTSDLHGPDTIGPNQSQVYRSRLFSPIASAKTLKAVVSCDNCRK
jgi:hypothetical protein